MALENAPAITRTVIGLDRAVPARSGPGGKGGKVKSRKQAIAIGLSRHAKKAKRCLGKRLPEIQPSIRECRLMDKIGEPAVKVRAGRLGRPVLAVLIASTLLLIVALAAVYIGYFAG